MSAAVRSLQAEHGQIARVLDAFAGYVGRLERAEAPPREDLEQFVRFFREFTDYHHHDKEESVLLPALVRAGVGWDAEPIVSIRRDHDQERYLLRVLRHAAMQAGAWSAEAHRHVTAVARELVAFLRAHMDREEALLFPVVASRLAASEGERLARDFERFDAQTEPAMREDLERLARDLCARYGAGPPG